MTYDLKDSSANTDLAGRVKRITTTTSTAPSTRIDRIDYNENGLISALTLGNGLVEHWSYNARLQPIDIRLDNGQSGVVGEWQFGYCAGAGPGADCGSNNGNVRTQLILPVNIYQNYNYDVLNRISGIEESASPGVPSGCPAGTTLCREFKCDDWANLYVASTRVMPTTAFTPVGASNFNAKNQLQINNAAYNFAGTQSAIGDYRATYDHENRLVNATLTGVSSTTYQYDGLGRRVSKTSGGSTTIYVYDASGNLAAEYRSPAAASGERYLTADHLGSIRLTTDGSGIADRRFDYLPFGEIIPAGVGGRTTAMGYEADESISPHRLRFTGKERDAETGLDYFGARYFSAAQGRFTSPDKPFADQTPFNPQSWNLYSYAHNNPLRFIDPTGRCSVAAGGYTDEGKGLFPGKCSEGQIGGTKPQQVTVGVGRDEANFIMLSMVGDRFSSTHQWATVVSGGGQGAMAVWGVKSLLTGGWRLLAGVRGLLGTTEMVAGLYGSVSKAALEAAASGGGDTVKVVTNLTQAPAAGRALSVAVGEGADALAGAARDGGTTYAANIPRALIQLMRGAGLVTESTTQMGGAKAAELQFTPNAAEFVVGFFKPIQ